MWPCSKTMRPVRLVDRRWRRRDLHAWSVRHGLCHRMPKNAILTVVWYTPDMADSGLHSEIGHFARIFDIPLVPQERMQPIKTDSVARSCTTPREKTVFLTWYGTGTIIHSTIRHSKVRMPEQPYDPHPRAPKSYPLAGGGAKRRRVAKRTIRHRTTEMQDHPHRYAGAPRQRGGAIWKPRNQGRTSAAASGSGP